MKPAAFSYHAPESARGAVELLAELGDAAKVLAGGQSLVPMLALRLTAFDHLVDVGRIPDLRGIERHGDTLHIGAATTEAAIGASTMVQAAAPLLAQATPYIGHFQIRNRGTAGGSIAHADPAAEYPAVAVALDAEMEALSPRGRRRIPASGFFTGIWTTVLQPDELLVAVQFPVWSGRCGFAVREFARRHGDFAIAGAVIGLQLDADDRVRRCAIGLIGLGSTPLRAPAAEKEVLGLRSADVSADEIGRLAVSDLSEVPSDMHAPADYRKRVGAAMVARAFGDAILEAQHG